MYSLELSLSQAIDLKPQYIHIPDMYGSNALLTVESSMIARTGKPFT
jgi:hypothetical protein